jgi:hypothetical protein
MSVYRHSDALLADVQAVLDSSLAHDAGAILDNIRAAEDELMKTRRHVIKEVLRDSGSGLEWEAMDEVVDYLLAAFHISERAE